MSGAPSVRSLNVSGSEVRPVLGAGGNKAKSFSAQKPDSKPLRKVEKSQEGVTEKEAKALSVYTAVNVPPILRGQELLLSSSLSLNASCSSDASTDSFHSRASTGRITRSSSSVASRRNRYASRPRAVVSAGVSESLQDGSQSTKGKCAWVTPNTDPLYAAFHNEEWGVPVHEDKKLFELLVLSGALSELTWPAILSRRQIFREVFADFDPHVVSKLNEKKLIAPGSTASSLLSELKLRAVIENARQISKVIDEFGSFDKYIWGFVNYKPVVGKFRYSRQVPVKTPKADAISKDLVRRGFRSVGPTVVYSFMQVAGITNDHLTSCYRFPECVAAAEEGKEGVGIKTETEDKKNDDGVGIDDVSRAIDELSFSSG